MLLILYTSNINNSSDSVPANIPRECEHLDSVGIVSSQKNLEKRDEFGCYQRIVKEKEKHCMRNHLRKSFGGLGRVSKAPGYDKSVPEEVSGVVVKSPNPKGVVSQLIILQVLAESPNRVM